MQSRSSKLWAGETLPWIFNGPDNQEVRLKAIKHMCWINFHWIVWESSLHSSGEHTQFPLKHFLGYPFFLTLFIYYHSSRMLFNLLFAFSDEDKK